MKKSFHFISFQVESMVTQEDKKQHFWGPKSLLQQGCRKRRKKERILKRENRLYKQGQRRSKEGAKSTLSENLQPPGFGSALDEGSRSTKRGAAPRVQFARRAQRYWIYRRYSPPSIAFGKNLANAARRKKNTSARRSMARGPRALGNKGGPKIASLFRN